MTIMLPEKDGRQAPKSKGKEVTVSAPGPKPDKVVDIMEALNRSVERAPAKK